ncbi:MAG: phosphoribosylglycinamide formyltransferase [Chthoniobacterales bacterium]
MPALRLAILGSGKGSNCRAILERIRDGELSAEARVIISDVEDAGILEISREFSVAGVYLAPGNFRTRLSPESEMALVRWLQESEIELVVLAGFMRVLKTPTLDAFPHRIINIHPSLLPKFRGLEAWTQALAAGEKVTGCTVHYVDAGVDEGEIIAQKSVPILPDDTPETLHARIQVAERELYPAVIAQFCQEP